MADYINRDSVIELSREYYSQGLKEEAVPVRAIRNIPSADVAEVRHGEWEVFDEPDTNAYECTACHDVFWLSDGTPFENNYNFCPNCGARMDMDGGT